ncbi:hypothetical protein ABH930_001736 [Kitasatospora sp. GAS204A]|uniref:serine protease n=1 Tax=unclassified Kitasatospora TaxID=2633591 RepID=UPI00247388FD|nr:serine protease [Kitasatospora sp. GAS204B]MDH6117279.1 hypothetical protein [Kitasatospora sp. GAS204B]
MIKSRLTQGLVAIVALLIGLVAAPPAGAVVGGSDAAQGQFPYLVSVVSSGIFGDSHICGGAILDATTVLTAAHCADGGTTSSLKVSYGSANRTAGTKASLNRVIMHPSYSSSTIDNDLAVLKLSSPIPLDGVNAAAIPLAAAGSVASGAVQVAGWGRTAYGAPLPVQAQYAGLNVVDRATCNGRWGGINLITKNMMCAGGANDGLTSCNGDSGGPLVQDQGGTAVLVGIVSWGKFGCTSDYPAVFADVAEPGLRSWINNLSGTAARSAAVTRPAATPLAAPASSDHGCPFDSVCLYTTTADYQNDDPAVIDNQALYATSPTFTVQAGAYAEVVDNTGFAPEYASEGTIALGLLGECVYVPEDTEAAGTDTAMSALGVNAVVVAPTQGEVDSLVVPCPAK